MSRSKKSHKSSDSESETSSDSSTSSDSADEEQQMREKEKRKQVEKKHKKVKSVKKKSKHKSDSDDSAEESTSSLEGNKKFTNKKLKKQVELSPLRVKRERSRSRRRERNSKSKWESPPRRARSRSREKHRNERNGSREKQRKERSRSRNRDRSQEHDSRRGTERYHHGNRDHRERRERRDYENRDKEQSVSYDRRDPRRDVEKSRERLPERDYTNREQRSPNRTKGSSNRYRSQRKEDVNSYEWGKSSENKKIGESETKEKEKPNFSLSGALMEDSNKVDGVVIKYAEPPEARKPKRRWRLYPFKGETALPVLHIHRQSCFLVGRDRKVADLAVDHPSCSKQHAALQYRLVPFEREDGSQGKRVRLYLIDLESANGTFLNNKRIDARKYYELMEKDVVKFGFSTREYVLLHENSKEDQEDDDIEVKEEPLDN